MGRRHRHLTPASLGVAIAYDARRITGLANGANLTAWDNIGTLGSAFNLTTTGFSDLTYRSAEQGGQPAVRRTGFTATLTTGSQSPLTNGYSNELTLVSANSSSKGAGTARLLYMWVPATTTNDMRLWSQFSDNNMYFDMGNAGSNGRISGAVSTTSASVIHSAMKTTTDATVRRSGTTLISGAMAGSMSAGSSSFILLGDTSTSSYNGDIQAFYHTPSASEPMRRRMEQSMAFAFKIAI